MTDQTALAPPATQRSTIAGLLIALVAVAVWVGLVDAKPFTPFSDRSFGAPIFWGAVIGQVLGSGLLAGAVVWVVLFFAYVRNVNPKAGAAHLMILLGAALLVGAFSTLLIGVPRAALDGRQKLETFARTYDQTLDQDSRNYQAAMDAVGLDGMLKPEALAADRGLAATRARIARARAVVAQYQALQSRRRADARSQIATISPSALAGYDKGAANSQTLVDQHWALERRLVDEADVLVTTLAQAKGGWRASGGVMTFTRAADTDAFNRHVVALQDLEQQELSLQRTFNNKDQKAHRYLEEMHRRNGGAP